MTKPERIVEIRPQLSTFPELSFGEPNQALVDKIDGLRPGDAIFNRKYFGALSQSGLVGFFEEDPKLMIGRKGGVHQSYAGYIHSKSKKDQWMTRTVFVKPFQNEEDCRNGEPAKDMVHEIAASEAIAKLYDYQVTFNILGVAKSSNGTPQLLSDFNMPVTAISKMLRPEGPHQPVPTVEQISKAIIIAMHEAGTLVGGLGSTHRDFHVGNVARGIEYTPWYNDNETMLPLDNRYGQVVDSDDNRRKVLGDLSRFFNSVVNPNFTRADTVKKIFNVIDNPKLTRTFLSTYQKSIMQASANSGIVVPERYYMTQGSFTGLALNSTKQAREKFGL